MEVYDDSVYVSHGRTAPGHEDASLGQQEVLEQRSASMVKAELAR